MDKDKYLSCTDYGVVKERLHAGDFFKVSLISISELRNLGFSVGDAQNSEVLT